MFLPVLGNRLFFSNESCTNQSFVKNVLRWLLQTFPVAGLQGVTELGSLAAASLPQCCCQPQQGQFLSRMNVFQSFQLHCVYILTNNNLLVFWPEVPFFIVKICSRLCCVAIGRWGLQTLIHLQMNEHCSLFSTTLVIHSEFQLL